MTRNATRTLLTLALLTVVGLPAAADDPPAWKDEIRLGYAVGDPPFPSGRASRGSTGTMDFFTVRASAQLPDGTVLVVAIQDADALGTPGWTDVGTISLQLGSGLLGVNEVSAPDSAAFPAIEIAAVRVSHDGTVILYGEF